MAETPRYFLTLQFPRRTVSLGRYRFYGAYALHQAFERHCAEHGKGGLLNDMQRQALEDTLTYLGETHYQPWMCASQAPKGITYEDRQARLAPATAHLRIILPYIQNIQGLSPSQRLRLLACLRQKMRPHLNARPGRTVSFLCLTKLNETPVRPPSWVQKGGQSRIHPKCQRYRPVSNAP
jgi:hypothetical protein